jgi:C1A family cysteine protease
MDHQHIVDEFQQHATHKCTVRIPRALGEKVDTPAAPAVFPKTFVMQMDYKQRLKECQCNAVYTQQSRQGIANAIAERRTAFIKPRAMLPPVNTNISFFQSVPRYKIVQSELDTQLQLAKSLPAYFNWAEQSDEISKPMSQGMCGSCYSIAVATCLSDRYVVQHGVKNPEISAAYLLSCYPQGPSSQCAGGGDPVELIREVQRKGATDETCLDYEFCAPMTACGGNPNLPFDPARVNDLIPPCACKNRAAPTRKYTVAEAAALCIPPVLDEFADADRVVIRDHLDHLYGERGAADLSTLPYKDIQALIKQHIHTQGPVIGGFHVFRNFLADLFAETNDVYIESATYKGVAGVDYKDPMRDWIGSHAVVIVGWGETTIGNETVPYWIVRNSWGVNWGQGGYFRMAMYGTDPNKTYQNRIAQFEYPTVLRTPQGLAVTGGVLLMKPGSVEAVASARSTRALSWLILVPLVWAVATRRLRPAWLLVALLLAKLA